MKTVLQTIQGLGIGIISLLILLNVLPVIALAWVFLIQGIVLLLAVIIAGVAAVIIKENQ